MFSLLFRFFDRPSVWPSFALLNILPLFLSLQLATALFNWHLNKQRTEMVLNLTVFTFPFETPQIFANYPRLWLPTYKRYPIRHVQPFWLFVCVRKLAHSIQNFTLFATHTTTKQTVPKAAIFCFAFPKWCHKISYAFFRRTTVTRKFRTCTKATVRLQQIELWRCFCNVCTVRFKVELDTQTHRHTDTDGQRHYVTSCSFSS